MSAGALVPIAQLIVNTQIALVGNFCARWIRFVNRSGHASADNLSIIGGKSKRNVFVDTGDSAIRVRFVLCSGARLFSHVSNLVPSLIIGMLTDYRGDDNNNTKKVLEKPVQKTGNRNCSITFLLVCNQFPTRQSERSDNAATEGIRFLHEFNKRNCSCNHSFA
jgi:hypothetical protein